FPGVTVEKRSGNTLLPNGELVEVIDLPGIYSIYPRSLDEQIVGSILLDHHSPESPDKVIVIADATNLKRSLLLVTQIIDIGLPVVLALSMMDLAARAGISYDIKKLSARLGVPVVPINGRSGIGLDDLKQQVAAMTPTVSGKQFLDIWEDARGAVKELRERTGVDNDYEAYQFLEQPKSLNFLSAEQRAIVDEVRSRHNLFPGKFQGAETIQRYGIIQDLLNEVTIKTADHSWKKTTSRLDKLVTHKGWGYVIFFSVLFLIFQAIFAWATIPMDFIDEQFANLSAWLQEALPEGPLTSLLAEGIVPGIGGIVIFVPQIAILFAFISLLEESGYMARVVFLMDKIMRKFGLNGKSVVPLMSGVACAIPAIMATRTIDNWKER